MTRHLTLAFVLTARVSLGFWAPNHENINLQILREGTPWGDSIMRSAMPIRTFDEYLSRVLYISTDPLPRRDIPETPGARGGDPCEHAKRTLHGVAFDNGNAGATIGNDKPTDAPNLALTPGCWVARGGLWEDGFMNMDEGVLWGGRRAVNHFHDPLSTKGGGYTGILNENRLESVPYLNMARHGISVTEWVMNGHSGGDDGFNAWGYPSIGAGLHRAFTERDLEKRESGMAAAFRAIGQMMHLISDNTVPDHARDLPHPGYGFEEYMREKRPALFGGSPVNSWIVFPVRTLSADGIRGFWDRDVFATGPEGTLSGVTRAYRSSPMPTFWRGTRSRRPGSGSTSPLSPAPRVSPLNEGSRCTSASLQPRSKSSRSSKDGTTW